jgi:hypothetical protein
MAAPHVGGVAALYLQYRPGASPQEVKVAVMRAAAGEPITLLLGVKSRFLCTCTAVPFLHFIATPRQILQLSLIILLHYFRCMQLCFSSLPPLSAC